VGGVVIVIVAGLLVAAPAAVPEAAQAATPDKPWHAGIGMAMLFVLFTYSGWNESAYVSAEVKDAQRNMVRALVLSILLVTVLYVLANWAFLRALGMPAIAKSQAVAADLLEKAWGTTGATLISMVVFVTLFFVFDLYSTERKTRSARDLFQIMLIAALAVPIITVFYFFLPFWKVGSRSLLMLQALFVGLAAYVWRALYTRVHRAITRPRRILVIGAGRAATRLLEEIHERFRHDYEIVGVVDDDPGKVNFELNGYRVIGGTADVRRLAVEREAEILVFAIPRQNNPIDAELMADILGLKTGGVEVYQMATFFKQITGRVPIEIVETSWLVFNQEFVGTDTGPAGKLRRLIDVSIAAFALVLLSPLILAIAVAIKLGSPGPVLYRQERLGHKRRPYQMVKFRSMRVDAERGKPVWSAGKADSRVTKVGRFLRRTRMDEIPNFWNVLKGEMSVVGPRPERAHFVETLEREIPHYGLRFAVKPGLTGWAQVNFSYGASVADAQRKLQYEMFYIQERSLFFDLVILLKTAQTILTRSGS
jgi:exopolysaccharide biosynthesis polyprenyl glycosylphosphotransferase